MFSCLIAVDLPLVERSAEEVGEVQDISNTRVYIGLDSESVCLLKCTFFMSRSYDQ